MGRFRDVATRRSPWDEMARLLTSEDRSRTARNVGPGRGSPVSGQTSGRTTNTSTTTRTNGEGSESLSLPIREPGPRPSSRVFARWTERAHMACPFREQERGRRFIAITPFYGAAGNKETTPCSGNRRLHDPSVELGITAYHANCVPSATSPDLFIGDKDASPGRQNRFEDTIGKSLERARSSFDTMTGRETGGYPSGSITIHFGIPAGSGVIKSGIDRERK